MYVLLCALLERIVLIRVMCALRTEFSCLSKWSLEAPLATRGVLDHGYSLVVPCGQPPINTVPRKMCNSPHSSERIVRSRFFSGFEVPRRKTLTESVPKRPCLSIQCRAFPHAEFSAHLASALSSSRVTLVLLHSHAYGLSAVLSMSAFHIQHVFTYSLLSHRSTRAFHTKPSQNLMQEGLWRLFHSLLLSLVCLAYVSVARSCGFFRRLFF